MPNRQRGATTIEALGPVVPLTAEQATRMLDLTADQPDQADLLAALGIEGRS